MTPEQRLRLARVSERLAEAVIVDVDPENWAAAGMTPAEMARDQRGDAAWCRKVAAQSVALLVRVEQLLGTPDGAAPPGDVDPEAEIKRAEKAASKALDRALASADRG